MLTPTVVDHAAIEEIGIDLIAYHVADFYEKLDGQRMVLADCSALLHLSPNQFSAGRKVCLDTGLLTEDNGIFTVTPYWKSFKTIQFETRDAHVGIWEEFLEFYNPMATKLGIPNITPNNRTDKKLLMDIVRMNPSVEIEHIQLVFNYLYTKWKGTDYQQYVRPKTILKNSAKFNSYLNEANGYRMMRQSQVR